MSTLPPVFAHGTIVQFIDCSIVRDGQIIKEDLWVRDGRIIDPEILFYDEKISSDVKISCYGNLIAPGYIDLQINGGYGYDFSDDTLDIPKAIDVVARGLLRTGVTSFCPTLITQSSTSYHKILPQIKRRQGNASLGASVLGAHLEGPFISKNKRGAHPPHLVKSDLITSWSTIEDCYGPLDNVAIVTMAPELDGGSIIRSLRDRGIVISIGHSTATLNQGLEALKNGANFITHLFNAMLPFHHRDPGLVGLITAQEDHPLYYGIIADGVHTHEAALRIAYRSNPSGLVLVTDAISAMGLPSGTQHRIGDQIVEIRDKKAFVAGTETLCGSIATMDQCVKNLKKATMCTTVQAIECASLHPAQVMGLSNRKGTLNYGADGDFIILDKDLNVLATFVEAQPVWLSNSSKSFKIIKQ